MKDEQEGRIKRVRREEETDGKERKKEAWSNG
jgi:hypothetical protein